jgi:hypothetical protein
MLNAITFAVLMVYFNNKEAIDVIMQHILWIVETWIYVMVDNSSESGGNIGHIKTA